MKTSIFLLLLCALLMASRGYAQTESVYGAPSIPALSSTSEVSANDTVVVTAPAMTTAHVPDPDPAYGDRLPLAWMKPYYFISYPKGLGLPAPAPGFGWSRYGNIAVLTDQWGRIYSAESRIKWERLNKARKPVRPNDMRYRMHWTPEQLADSVTYEEVRTTRIIPGETRRVKRTTYEWVSVPSKTSRRVRPKRPAQRGRIN